MIFVEVFGTVYNYKEINGKLYYRNVIRTQEYERSAYSKIEDAIIDWRHRNLKFGDGMYYI